MRLLVFFEVTLQSDVTSKSPSISCPAAYFLWLIHFMDIGMETHYDFQQLMALIDLRANTSKSWNLSVWYWLWPWTFRFLFLIYSQHFHIPTLTLLINLQGIFIFSSFSLSYIMDYYCKCETGISFQWLEIR